MDVSIIIPNFNGKSLLEKHLSQVTKLKDIKEIIVVDDASTDGSVEYLNKYFPQVKLIEKVKNDGFATTVNLGVKAASGDIIILLNTDVIPFHYFLKPLLSHFKDEKVFSVGCLDKSIEDETVIERGRGVGAFARGFLVHSRGEVDKTDTLWVNGGSGAYRISIWKELGGMDELYNPFYWEDIDLSYRAQKAGYRVLFEPKSIVEHRHETGAIKTQFDLSRIRRIAYRNQIVFVWKNITDPAMIFSHILWLPYHLVVSLLRNDFAFWQGLVSAMKQIPTIIKRRAYQKKYQKYTDAQIIGHFNTEYADQK